MGIDLIAVLFFGYGFFQGYNRGIIRTIFNILAYFFGVLLAFKMTPIAANVLQQISGSENPLYFLAGFLLNMFIIVFVLRTAGKGMESAFNAAYLGPVNRILGGTITGAVSLLIFSVLIWFGVKGTLLKEGDATLGQSRLYPFLKEMPTQAKGIAGRLKPLAEDFWNNSSNWMDKIEKYGLEQTESSPTIYDIHEDAPPIEQGTNATSPDGIEYDTGEEAY